MATLVALVGCSLPSRECRSPELICVGLVTGFGSTDVGPAHEAWLALEDARSAGEIGRADFISTIDTRDRPANLAYFAEAGYDIVVTLGEGIFDEAAGAAERYPGVIFVVIQASHASSTATPNLVKMEFREEDAGYLAGATAARLTRTGHVAAVCEARFIDYVQRYCEGFRLGAEQASGDVVAAVVYRPGSAEALFHDAAWGRSNATKAVEEGADVIFAVGEGTGLAALEQAAQDGAFVIGAQTDVEQEIPEMGESVVTSVTLDIRGGLRALIKGQLHGQSIGEAFWGKVQMTAFGTPGNRLPAGAEAELRRLEADLNAGRVSPNLEF